MLSFFFRFFCHFNAPLTYHAFTYLLTATKPIIVNDTMVGSFYLSAVELPQAFDFIYEVMSALFKQVSVNFRIFFLCMSFTDVLTSAVV